MLLPSRFLLTLHYLSLIHILKSDVRVLNFARGGLIDDEAMMKAMDEGKIAAYVTDFPTKELLQYEQVIGVPHLGASTPESEENCAVMAANEIMEYLETGNITPVSYTHLDVYKRQIVYIR